MDRFTRFVLRLLGWTASKGVDASGRHYEAWYRLGRPRPAYFFVFHERLPDGTVTLPVWKPRPKKRA